MGEHPCTGQAVTVMGLGLYGGGAAAARYLHGIGAEVTVTDLRGPEVLRDSLAEIEDLGLPCVLGEHRTADFDHGGWVVANPAVRPDNEFLRRAREHGAKITSETALFLAACRGQVHGITGTNGKSSTCRHLDRLLRAGGLGVHLGGNIGRSLLPELASIGVNDHVVLELSSYQLEALEGDPLLEAVGGQAGIGLRSAAITNVGSDHLERHGTLEGYFAAKVSILGALAPGGTAFLPADDDRFQGVVHPGRRTVPWGPSGAVRVEGECFSSHGTPLGRVADLRLPGRAQRENVLLALGIAHGAGVDPKILAATLPKLEAPDHRLEDLGVFGGHRVWDDGVSTTPDSTLAALEAIDDVGVLLLGGQAKDLDFDPLFEEIARRDVLAICFGEAAPRLYAGLQPRGARSVVVAGLEDAVRRSFAELEPGQSLVFSPSCASFDAYRNVVDRARAFRAALPRA